MASKLNVKLAARSGEGVNDRRRRACAGTKGGRTVTTKLALSLRGGVPLSTTLTWINIIAGGWPGGNDSSGRAPPG